MDYYNLSCLILSSIKLQYVLTFIIVLMYLYFNYNSVSSGLCLLVCSVSSMVLRSTISLVSGRKQHKIAAQKAKPLNTNKDAHSIPIFTTNGAAKPPALANTEANPIAEFLTTVGNTSEEYKYTCMNEV